MTLEDLQKDIQAVNALMDAIAALTPTEVDNKVVDFLKALDNNSIMQNVLLVILNVLLSGQPVNIEKLHKEMGVK